MFCRYSDWLNSLLVASSACSDAVAAISWAILVTSAMVPRTAADVRSALLVASRMASKRFAMSTSGNWESSAGSLSSPDRMTRLSLPGSFGPTRKASRFV